MRNSLGSLLLLLGMALSAALNSTAADPSVPPALRQVVIVFKTHFDIGYTDLATNVVARYRTTMIDEALKVVDQNRDLPPREQFVWTIPGWPAARIAGDWPGQTKERQGRIQQAFRDGRFVVHALPFSLHTELFEPEDLVRGLSFSSRLCRGLGLPLPRDAKMTDVPCHSWILPTLLRHAGVEFLHLGCNPASSSPRLPLLFWWEGPDGSRLLTMYSAGDYGSGLAPPADWPYQTWLALIHTGDNSGPPRPREVGQLLEEAKRKLPGVSVRIGRMSDFADAIRAEHASIPVVRGDMPDTWVHGPMCDPAGAREARNLRPAIGATELLGAELAGWNAGFDPGDSATRLAAAREKSLLYGEHTWGGSLGWVVQYSQHTPFWYGEAWKEQRQEGRFKKLESSWAEHSAYIEEAEGMARPILDRELAALARSVKVEGERIVVFNPLPWKRDGLVRVPGVGPHPAVRAADGGPRLPAWRESGDLCFVAHGLPPCGYRTYRFAPEAAASAAVRVDENSNTLESPTFKAVIDPGQGSIRSLIDQRTRRELVGARSGFGRLLYERFDAAQVADYVKAYVKIGSDWAVTELGKPGLPSAAEVPYQAGAPGNCELRFERSPETVTAVWHSSASRTVPFAVTTRLTLYASLPCADLEIGVRDKPADPWPEAAWIRFPFQVEAPQFRLGRLGGIVDPVREFVPGANHDFGGVHTGVALFDVGGHGVGLCSLDGWGVSLDRPGGFKYTPTFAPERPDIYVHLFNNQWSTNFRLWNSGSWSWRVRLWSFEHYDNNLSLITPSVEARQPLLAACADGLPGSLPPTQRGLALARPGILVTAFGPNPDGEGVVLRLWEYAGRSGPCRVELPNGLTAATAQPVDLRGRPAGPPVRLERGHFDPMVHAFEPVSYVVSRARWENGR